MKTLSTLIALVLFASTQLVGQGTSTGSSQLKLPANAWDASLGQSGTASAGSIHASSLNPATLYTVNPLQVVLSHMSWIQDLQRQLLQVRFPLFGGTTALAVSSSSLSGIEIREQPGPASGTFNATAVVFEAAGAFPINESVIVGASVNYLYEKIFIDEATGTSVNLGILFTPPVEHLTIGCAVTHLGSMSALRSTAGTLPTAIRCGAQYQYTLSDIILTPSAAISYETHIEQFHGHAGIEGWYSNLLAVRCGYVTGYEARGFGAGLGIRHSGLQLDYAYLPFSLGLGDAHILSLAFQF